MPFAPLTPCAQPGCPELTDGRYCAKHMKVRRKQDDMRRGSSTSRGYDARWRKARKQFLKIHPTCVECERDGRFTAAIVVDHIIPHKGDMKLFWDRSNWQALCKECHDRKTVLEDGGFGNRRVTAVRNVVVICGPPGSGKTTYVNERSSWGDIVVDVDALFSAVTGKPWYDKPANLVPFVLELRDHIYDMISNGITETSRVWIITSGSKASDRMTLVKRFDAELVMLDVSPIECMNRIMKDKRRCNRASHWQEIIDCWWKNYQSRDRGI